MTLTIPLVVSFHGTLGSFRRSEQKRVELLKIEQMAMGQKNRTPSEHPNPTTKIGSKMGGEFTYPKMEWDPLGFDPRPNQDMGVQLS